MAYELCSSCVLPWTMFRLMAYEFALSLNEEELKTIKKGGADNNHHMDKKEKEKEKEKERRRRSRSRSTNQVKLNVSKWLKWKLGRRPGHRSIWTVFVSDGYDLFPSFRPWWR